MSIKENFTPEEWKLLLKAPLMVSYSIMGASPGSKKDFENEMKAVADAIVYSSEKASSNSLVGSVANEIRANAMDESVGAKETIAASEIKGRTLEICRQLVPILQAKTDNDEAESYKRWLLAVAQQVAEASKEGGFMGFGGALVSDSERATLDEITMALEI